MNPGRSGAVHFAVTAAKTTTGSGEVCRLTVCGPDTRIELAVPAHVPLADLMPTFLGYLGPDLAQSGLAHDGWVLQRLGEPALEEDLAAAALGLYDGDVIHLRPRNDQLPPVDFDDIVDGVATGIAERTDRWRPETTSRLLLCLVAATLSVTLAALPQVGSGTEVAVTAAAAGLLTLLGAAAAGVALRDRVVARLLIIGATGFWALAGLALPVGAKIYTDQPFSGPGALAAGAAVVAVTGLAGLLLGQVEPWHVAVGVGAGLVLAAAVPQALGALDPQGAAAVSLALSLAGAVLVPSSAARLAGLRIPPLPTNTDEFQQGIDPEPSHLVLSRTALADSYVTALSAALAALQCGCLLLLGLDSGAAPQALTVVAALLILLHARDLLGVRARLAVLVPAVTGPVVLVLAGIGRLPQPYRPVVVGGLLVLAGVLLVLSRRLPGRAILPHWGRIGDIAQSLLAISVMPLVPGVIGLYARARSGWS